MSFLLSLILILGRRMVLMGFRLWLSTSIFPSCWKRALIQPVPKKGDPFQGSVLSSTLFLIFINDLLSITSSPIHSYADDSTLHFSFQYERRPSQQQLIDSRRMALEQLTSDLSRISNW